MPGAQCTRSLVRARGSQVCARVFTAEAPETSGIPHAMVLTAYVALSLGTGLSCPHRPRDASRDLSLSIGRPGPHAFAVRSAPLVLATTTASTASRTQRP